jgi:uncharacterized protein YbdZ (MbtH family)
VSLLPTPVNEQVAELEALVLSLPQTDLQTSHVVHGGMCARTILIPAGTVLTGALTNCDNICVMHGGITVTTDDGPLVLNGHHVLPANKGAKRAGWTHLDTYWTTIWPTQLTDITAIEDEMTSEAHKLQTRRDCLDHAKHDVLEVS